MEPRDLSVSIAPPCGKFVAIGETYSVFVEEPLFPGESRCDIYDTGLSSRIVDNYIQCTGATITFDLHDTLEVLDLAGNVTKWIHGIDFDAPSSFEWFRVHYSKRARTETVHSSGYLKVAVEKFDCTGTNDWERLEYRITAEGYVYGHIKKTDGTLVELTGNVLSEMGGQIYLESLDQDLVIHDLPLISFQDVNGVIDPHFPHDDTITQSSNNRSLYRTLKYVNGSLKSHMLFDITSFNVLNNLQLGKTVIEEGKKIRRRERHGYAATLGGVYVSYLFGDNKTIVITKPQKNDWLDSDSNKPPTYLYDVRMTSDGDCIRLVDFEGNYTEEIAIDVSSTPIKVSATGLNPHGFAQQLERYAYSMGPTGSIITAEASYRISNGQTTQISNFPKAFRLPSGHVWLEAPIPDKGDVVIQNRPYLTCTQVFGDKEYQEALTY